MSRNAEISAARRDIVTVADIRLRAPRTRPWAVVLQAIEESASAVSETPHRSEGSLVAAASRKRLHARATGANALPPIV
jgi:hypothetical protein